MPVRRLSVAALSALALALTSAPTAGAVPENGAASAADAAGVTVGPAADVVLVAEGGVADVGITLTVPGGGALPSEVSVTVASGAAGSTARAGSDYTAVHRTVRFAAGTPSGATRSVPLATSRDGAAEQAEAVRFTLTATGATVTGTPLVVLSAHGLPYLDSRRSVPARVADLMSRMTLADKIGQMTQAERADVFDDPARIAQWRLGSVLSGGGSTPPENTPRAWADMIDRFQSAALTAPLQIPLIYGIDAVHGNGNLRGATIFPHNVGLGATRNPRLVERVAHVTARETRGIGIPWNFAPCLCVARDDRWGRTYESFSEHPSLVEQLETSIDGFQGRAPRDLARPDRVLATAKHFAGDGDTEYGTGGGDYTIDQGVTVTDRRDFARIDLAPYVPAVRLHRVGSVMPSFSSVDWTEDGVGNPIHMHDNRRLITGWLKQRQGFDGFVITDWLGIHQITGDRGVLDPEDVRRGVNAGSDMFMEPGNAPLFQSLLTAHVASRAVSTARVDDAVRRILTKKFQLGLFERPFADRRLLDEIASPAHRAVARTAAAQSQVLLKNAGSLLPLRRDAKVYVAGRNADDLGNQAGGWTLQWQGVSGNDDGLRGTTILQGIRQVAPRAQVTYSRDASAPMAGADVGVVVVGETPYAEGFGDVGGPVWPYGEPAQREPKLMTLHAQDRAVVDRVCGAMRCVVLVVSGRPQVVSDQLGSIDALVASWLPGSEGAGVADVLFGRRPFTGRLSLTWPRSPAQQPINVGDASYDPQFPYGWGLRTDRARDRLVAALTASSRSADPRVRAVARHLRPVLAPALWTEDGGVRNEVKVVAALRSALAGLRSAGSASASAAALADVLVSVVRDVAQDAVVAGRAGARAPALIGQADVRLARGDAAGAARLLAQAAGTLSPSRP